MVLLEFSGFILPLSVLGGMILIGVLVTYFSKEARIKRKLKSTPITTIRAFRHGELGRITGHAEVVGAPLIAPLSKRKCAYYQVIVEQKKSSGKSSRWVEIIKDERYPPFMVREGNHHAIIDTKWVKTILDKDAKFSSGFLDDATEELQAYLKKHGHEDTGWLGFNKTLRYKEGIIEPGELVTVRGTGYWYDGKDQGLPSKFSRVLVLKSTEKEAIYITDLSNIVSYSKEY